MILHKRRHLLAASIAIPAVLAIAMLISLAIGPFDIPLWQIVSPDTDQQRNIIRLVRLPRTLMAVLAGGGLAVCGAVLQSLFRNPLADPGILGVSSGAALGAVAAIAFGLSAIADFSVPLFAVAGALSALLTIYAVATIVRQYHAQTLLLTGLAFTTFTGALISLLLISTNNLFLQREILFWLTGGLDTVTWGEVAFVSAPVAGGTIALIYIARELNMLAVGETEARAMGVSVTLLRTVIVVATALVTGALVAFTGPIGFVGLVVPHVLRLLFGPDNRALVPLSFAGGAMLLLVADMVARTVVSPAEIRIGIVTAMIGAPVFVYILLSNGKKRTV